FYNTFVLSVGSDRTPASALTKVHTVSITFVRLLTHYTFLVSLMVSKIRSQKRFQKVKDVADDS
ncbi:hypothetical protein, partial [Planktothrix sp. FACHB-1355]